MGAYVTIELQVLDTDLERWRSAWLHDNTQHGRKWDFEEWLSDAIEGAVDTALGMTDEDWSRMMAAAATKLKATKPTTKKRKTTTKAKPRRTSKGGK